MKKFRLLVFYSLLSLIAVSIQAADSKQQPRRIGYLTIDQLPNAIHYLPAPPDTASLRFVNDWHQYIWGKSLRNTPRGELAVKDATYGMARMLEIYSPIIGINISEKSTPQLYCLLRQSMPVIDMAPRLIKAYYNRTRPFVQFNEPSATPSAEPNLRHNGSYPSGHTCLGWSTALLLMEIAPAHQNELLQRAMEYGQSRVIVGAHFQSDVDAGRLVASSTIARLHADTAFCHQMQRAKEEYQRLTGVTQTAALPDGKQFLPEPADTMSMLFYGDWAAYCEGRALRNTPRGYIAKVDADWHTAPVLDGLLREASLTRDSVHYRLLTQLLDTIQQAIYISNTAVKDKFNRKRPYAQFGQHTLIPKDEPTHSIYGSYPSSHSNIGWSFALLLTELDPTHADAYLRRGYEYGHSREIAGYHYASDVQAARLMASAIYVQLHNNGNFMKLLDKLKQKKQKK